MLTVVAPLCLPRPLSSEGCLQAWGEVLTMLTNIIGRFALQTRLEHWQINHDKFKSNLLDVFPDAIAFALAKITFRQVTSLWAGLTFGSNCQTVEWQHATTHLLKLSWSTSALLLSNTKFLWGMAITHDAFKIWADSKEHSTPENLESSELWKMSGTNRAD